MAIVTPAATLDLVWLPNGTVHEHDWRCAQLLGQHRDRATGDWRCGVRYTVDVGMQYQRVVWADESRSPGGDGGRRLALRPEPNLPGFG